MLRSNYLIPLKLIFLHKPKFSLCIQRVTYPRAPTASSLNSNFDIRPMLSSYQSGKLIVLLGHVDLKIFRGHAG